LAQVVASFDSAALPDHLKHAERLTGVATARSGCGFRSLIRLCREALNRDPDPAPEFAELRSQYLDNRASELKALASALDRSEFTKLAAAGHNLKGTGGAYGFAELTEIGKALEVAAKDGDPLRVQILLGRVAFYLGLVRHGSIPA
jgi:HPt (histidine-containing phosphotransfer) domain-containing protein